MRARVLIVEDEVLVALDLEETITAAGGEVVGLAHDTDQARRLVEQEAFDVAILDANLNGDSARDVAVHLRAKSVPFIVLSGYTAAQLSSWLGEAPLVSKPYASEYLLAEIERLLGHDRAG